MTKYSILRRMEIGISWDWDSFMWMEEVSLMLNLEAILLSSLLIKITLWKCWKSIEIFLIIIANKWIGWRSKDKGLIVLDWDVGCVRVFICGKIVALFGDGSTKL